MVELYHGFNFMPWARGVLDIRPIRIAKSLTARGTLAA